MALPILIIIFLLILIPIIIFFKVIKGVIKTLFIIAFVLLLIFAIIGVMVFFDTSTLVSGLQGEKEIYLMSNNELTSGITTNSEEIKIINSKVLTPEELIEAQNNYFTGEKTSKFTLINYDFDKLILVFDNEYLGIASNATAENMVDSLAKKLKEEKTTYIIEGVVNDKVIIYPDFESFKILKILPGFIAKIYY